MYQPLGFAGDVLSSFQVGSPTESLEASESYLFLQALREAKKASMKEFSSQEKSRKRLEARLSKFNLVVNDDTDNQGDCQFDAVADQLNLLAKPGQEINKEQVRAKTIDWLRNNGGFRLSDDPNNPDTLRSWITETQGMEWESYCDRMAGERVWGDEITLRGLAEAFDVEIAVFSSTVDEDNFYSEHKPRQEAPEGAKRRRLLLCHFLEIHYGSLLSPAQLEGKERIKRAEVLKLLARCGAAQRLSFLQDIFVRDNSPDAEADRSVVDESMVAQTLINNGGSVHKAFSALADLFPPGGLRLKQHRLQSIRDKVALLPVSTQDYKALEAKTALLENDLAKALSLVDILTAENEALREKLPQTEKSAADANGGSGGGVDSVAASYLLDEDGKYWIEAAWNLGATGPLSGDMLSLHESKSGRVVQRLPSTSAPRGSALFDVPKKIRAYVVRLSRKGSKIAESPTFIVGPEVALTHQLQEGGALEVFWDMSRGKSSTYDWIGVFPQGQDQMDKYIAFQWVNPSTPSVKFPAVKSGEYQIRYFSGEEKYFPVADHYASI